MNNWSRFKPMVIWSLSISFFILVGSMVPFVLGQSDEDEDTEGSGSTCSCCCFFWLTGLFAIILTIVGSAVLAIIIIVVLAGLTLGVAALVLFGLIKLIKHFWNK